MKLEHIWAVRDCRVLNSDQKIFLMVVISRGSEGMFAKWHVNAADMSLKKDRYYEARNSLKEKGIVIPIRRYDGTTVYHYSPDGHSAYQMTHSDMENNRSGMQNNHSGIPETKVNTKKNMKENKKENITPVSAAAAPDVEDSIITKEKIQTSSSFEDSPGSSASSQEEVVPHSDMQNEEYEDYDEVARLLPDCVDPEYHAECGNQLSPAGDWDEMWDDMDAPNSPHMLNGVIFSDKHKAAKARHDFKYDGIYC